MDAVLQSKILTTLNSTKMEWLRVIKIKHLAGIDVPTIKVKNELDEMLTLGLVDTKAKPFHSVALYRTHLDENRPVDANEVVSFLRARTTHRPSIEVIAFELGYNEAALSKVIDNLVEQGVLEHSLYIGKPVVGMAKRNTYTPLAPEVLEKSILEALRLTNSSWAGVKLIRQLGNIPEKAPVIRAKLLQMAEENKINMKESAYAHPIFRMPLDPARKIDVEEVFEFVSKRAGKYPTVAYIAQELGYNMMSVGLAVEHLIARGDLVRREGTAAFASTKALVDHPSMRFRTKKKGVVTAERPGVAAPRTFQTNRAFSWKLPSYVEGRLNLSYSYKGVSTDPDIDNLDKVIEYGDA